MARGEAHRNREPATTGAFWSLSFQSGPRATPRQDSSISCWGGGEFISVTLQLFTEHQAQL